MLGYNGLIGLISMCSYVGLFEIPGSIGVDPQDSAPSHSIARSDFKESQGQPNPLTPRESVSLKALASASRGQLGGDNSMAKKLSV